MKIFRWLLCHSLIIIFLGLLVIVFIIKDDIKGNYNNLVGESTQTQTDNLNAQQIRPAVQKKEPEKRRADNSTTTNVIDAPSAKPDPIREDPWGEILNNPVVNSDVDKSIIDQKQASKFPPENYDPESSSVDKGAEHSNTSPKSGSRLSSEANGSEIDPATPDQTYFTALEAARRQYWQGQTDLAQTAYERLMFEYPNLPEAAEELGNLLLQQGNMNGATWAFKKAIPRYLNLHREQEAISIISLLSQYDPVVAETLQKKYW